jgi:hypothetical protein
MLLRTGQLSLELDPPISFTPAQLRGAIAAMWPEQDLLHQHWNGDHERFNRGLKGDGVIYMYPRIRYIVRKDSTALIIGIEEGVPVLDELVKRLEQVWVYLGQSETKIIKITLTREESNFGSFINKSDRSQSFLSYTIITPWLALNERNYEKYQRLGAWGKKKELLEKILIGNIISMSKSLGYTVRAPIKANIHNLKEVSTCLKGTRMLGFLGTFSVNFEIPNYWGIGKSVSRGFGTVKRIET